MNANLFKFCLHSFFKWFSKIKRDLKWYIHRSRIKVVYVFFDKSLARLFSQEKLCMRRNTKAFVCVLVIQKKMKVEKSLRLINNSFKSVHCWIRRSETLSLSLMIFSKVKAFGFSHVDEKVNTPFKFFSTFSI